MSKKYKGKICAYCAISASQTGDHVFARKFLLERHRRDLPKVPACVACNQEKARLEHYAATLLPFGGRHSTSHENLRTLVPSRLERNLPMAAKLNAGRKPVFEKVNGVILPTVTVPLDWVKLQRLFDLIFRGLMLHHWKVLVESSSEVEVIVLNDEGVKQFSRYFAAPAASKVSGDIGEGSFVYKGAQTIDEPGAAIWRLEVYGGLKMGDGSSASSRFSSAIGAFVVPRSYLENADRRARWLRGEGVES